LAPGSASRDGMQGTSMMLVSIHRDWEVEQGAAACLNVAELFVHLDADYLPGSRRSLR
jgi:hypothetical protein